MIVGKLLDVCGGDILMLTRADGCSCIVISVYMGHLDMVSILLQASKRFGLEAALLMLTTSDGSSCLLISAQMGYPHIVKALLKTGGRELLMLRRNDGNSPLTVSRMNVQRLSERAGAHWDFKSDHARVLNIIQQAYVAEGIVMDE
jgi:hypothetical protein